MPTIRAAIVTGAARGIGRQVTHRLLRDSWQVFALDRDGAALRHLRSHAPDSPPERLVTLAADTGDEAEIERAVSGISSHVGALHGLICNAGIMVRKPIATLSLEEWNRVLAVNLTGPFLLAKSAHGLLAAAGAASIVTIASTRAHMSEPDTESYAASKGGLLALTHALAISLGPAIRVNCISPGWIDVAGMTLRPEDHGQHPAGRVGVASDVADLAAWLLGAESQFVTGAEFIIDGGMTRKMIYLR